ncbi:MAG: ABC transporter ATP-binding protein/permease [Bacteroidales bacterium]|nr:ABC transporter ATP-binding protein/permease [Bacteroidales bacterium]
MKRFGDSVKGVLAICKPLRWRICVSVLIGLVRVAASLGFVWACKLLVDAATGAADSQPVAGIPLFAGTMLLQLLCDLAASYWENLTTIKAQNALRYKTFSHVLRSSWTGKEDYHSADVMNRMQEDIRVVTDLVCSRIPDTVVTLCQLAAASAYLMYLSPGLMWILVSLTAAAVLGSKLLFRKLRALTAKVRELDSASNRHMQENLQNRVLVLTLTGIENVLHKLKLVQDDIEEAVIDRLDYTTFARAVMGLGFRAGYAAAFLWGIFGIAGGTVTYGMMISFLQLVGQIQRPIADMSRHIPACIQALASEERITELTGMKEDIPLEGPLLESAPSIEFKDVTFSYPGQVRKVLDNFSHTFTSGTFTAVTGPTGSGKSTMARLAMGLLKPEEGSVSRIPVCNFMYVPQGNSLLSGTIRDNLLLANPNASEEAISQALHAADADFVFNLPDGPDCVCGEGGTGLSEGQAQRVSIARALLHPGNVLILDEATSSLDSDTENRVLERLVAGYGGRKTVIFISHRERVLSFADSILKIPA